MLKGVPKILSPELLKVLCEMGHGDRIVISDGNFPAESVGKNAIVIRCDGHGVPELLDAILKLFPLDTYVEKPVNLMEVMPGDTVETPIWETYYKIVSDYDKRGRNAVGNIERFKFYDEAKKAYAVIILPDRLFFRRIHQSHGGFIFDTENGIAVKDIHLKQFAVFFDR
jgi:L-fucose mutarotase